MRRTIVALVAVVAAGSLAPAATAGAPTGRADGDPGYNQPPEGACYRLSAKEVGRPSATKHAISCDREHTTMTIEVFRLSGPVDWDNVFSRLTVRCHKAFYAALGTTRYAKLSAYDFWWFRPTEEEREAGARWVRCDIGMHLNDLVGIQPIPASVRLGRPPFENRQSACLFGAYPDLRYTTCQRPHNYRAADVFRVKRLATTLEERQQQGLRCRQKVHSRHYLSQSPSVDEWKAGYHFVLCFKPHRLGDPRAGGTRR